MLVTIFQRFDLVMHDPTYELELKQTLTIKPHNFFVHALPRKDRSRLLAIPSSALLAHEAPAERAPKATVSAAAANLQPLASLANIERTPSREDGIPQELEEDLRAYGCKLIHQAGILLKQCVETFIQHMQKAESMGCRRSQIHPRKV